MMKLNCIKTTKIKNKEILADTIFNNFNYLTNFADLQHNKTSIINILNGDSLLCYFVFDDTDSNNRKMIAYLIGDFKKLNDGRYVYYLSYIYVSQAYRRQKIGKRLMERLFIDCKKNGCQFILLTFDTKDDKLIKFYKDYEFVPDPVLHTNNRHGVYTKFL